MDERFDLSRLTRTMQNTIIEHKEFSDINVPRFQEACFSGNLAAAKSIAANFTAEEATLGKNWALRYACAGGHLKVVIWMVEQFRLSIQDIRTNENQAFRWACSEGHLSVASWLVDRYGLTADDVQSVRNYALRIACENNHVPVVRWILKKFTIPDSVPRDNNYEILKFAYANSNYEIAKIITTSFNIHPDELSLFGASLVMSNSDDIFARIDAMAAAGAVPTTGAVPTAATVPTATAPAVDTPAAAPQKPPPNAQYSWWNPLYYIYGKCPDEEDNVVVVDIYSDMPALADIEDDSTDAKLPMGDRIVLELRTAGDETDEDAAADEAADDASSGDSDSDSDSDSSDSDSSDDDSSDSDD